MTKELEFKIQRIHRLLGNERIKAFVDLNISDVLVIKGLKVVQSKQVLFVSMPQEQGKDKRWYESIRCLSQDVRFELNKKILDAYNEDALVDSN